MSCVARVTALMLSIMSELLQGLPGNMGGIWGSMPHLARHLPSPAGAWARRLVDHVKVPGSLLDYLSIDAWEGAMRAVDVMTTNVITVDSETSVRALATLLSERGISGVP